tara:strand:- start:1131 stop:1574 length:444 start_codon:yes stop_codon:yes gene_type:complete
MNLNEIPTQTIEQNNILTSKLTKVKYSNGKSYEDELIMYNIIFPYLKLGKGKLLAQVSHGIQQATEYLVKHELDLYKRYTEDCIKITLKISSKDELFNLLDNTLNLKKFLVIDKGRTQCPENTLTCVTFLPIKRKDVPFEISSLPLY